MTQLQSSKSSQSVRGKERPTLDIMGRCHMIDASLGFSAAEILLLGINCEEGKPWEADVNMAQSRVLNFGSESESPGKLWKLSTTRPLTYSEQEIQNLWGRSQPSILQGEEPLDSASQPLSWGLALEELALWGTARMGDGLMSNLTNKKVLKCCFVFMKLRDLPTTSIEHRVKLVFPLLHLKLRTNTSGIKRHWELLFPARKPSLHPYMKGYGLAAWSQRSNHHSL